MQLENWKRQQRNEKGQFMSYDGTRNHKFTRQDVMWAFLAGLNNQGRFMLPSEKLAAYMRQYDDNT